MDARWIHGIIKREVGNDGARPAFGMRFALASWNAYSVSTRIASVKKV